MAQFRKHIAVAALVALSGVFVACGSDDNSNSQDPSAATTTTDPMGGGVGNEDGTSGTGAPEDVNPNNPGSDDQAPAETGD